MSIILNYPTCLKHKITNNIIQAENNVFIIISVSCQTTSIKICWKVILEFFDNIRNYQPQQPLYEKNHFVVTSWFFDLFSTHPTFLCIISMKVDKEHLQTVFILVFIGEKCEEMHVTLIILSINKSVHKASLQAKHNVG